MKDNLASPDGRTVVPAGALLRGKVVDVQLGVEPTMKVDFQTIGTTSGDVPIDATVTRAQEYVWIEPGAVYDRAAGYDTILYHPIYHPAYVPPIPDRSDTNLQFTGSGEFNPPEGTELTLTLARPLLGPTAHVRTSG